MLWDGRARPWPGSVHAANAHGPPGRFAVGRGERKPGVHGLNEFSSGLESRFANFW